MTNAQIQPNSVYHENELKYEIVPKVPYDGCCPETMIEISENMATFIFIVNILVPPFGTFIASCANERGGCKCTTFGIALL